MLQIDSNINQNEVLTAENQQLRQELDRLRQENHDLQVALVTTAEHGDAIEAELYASNRQLQAEIAERQLAQTALQQILETVSADKADLELILRTTTEHGDMVEYEHYTRAVESMRQNEDLLRAIAESTPVLMFLTQRQDGTITYANSAVNEQLGIENKALLGRHLKDFYANPADEHRLMQQLERQGSVRNQEIQLIRLDGTDIWVSASIHPLPLDPIHTLLTTFYNISDRKQAEAILQDYAEELERQIEQRTSALRQGEKKYRNMFENAVEGIFQTTPEGRYLNANPALARIYGYGSPRELIMTVRDLDRQLYAQPNRRKELNAYLKRFDAVSEFESQVFRKDGSTIWIAESVRVVKDQVGDVLYYEGSVQDITDRKQAEAELRNQRQVAEKLLLNVLPQPIAERLKQGQKAIADHFAEATVLFADIANFTNFSAQISPIELVELLNRIFSAFDDLADRHGLEKIKTIGDAYMVVGGVPLPRPDHLMAVANMALDLQQAIAQFTTQDGQPLALRIGIHTGSVVAGITGTRKFFYDLWGDTVNIASRMESQGEVGRIQVTEAVYERLRKRYRLEERGAIEVKGRGAMTTYWLLAKRESGM
jgi:PAS domain S-box-containing protein